MLASVRDANASGASRRRQRRLRQWLRHERLSVAMALAESQHHTAPRGPKMAMARGERYELDHNGEVPEALLPQPELFSLFEAEPGGSRPPRQGEPLGPQVGFCGAPWSRSPTSAPSCRCSMILRRKRGWGILLLEVYRTLDLVVSEQATDVPKSTQDGIQQRLVDQDLRQAQMAEQLVEMPEFVQFASMLQQQRAEQIVNIPVPGGSRHSRRGPQGFFPGQGSMASSSVDRFFRGGGGI